MLQERWILTEWASRRTANYVVPDGSIRIVSTSLLVVRVHRTHIPIRTDISTTRPSPNSVEPKQARSSKPSRKCRERLFIVKPQQPDHKALSPGWLARARRFSGGYPLSGPASERARNKVSRLAAQGHGKSLRSVRPLQVQGTVILVQEPRKLNRRMLNGEVPCRREKMFFCIVCAFSRCEIIINGEEILIASDNPAVLCRATGTGCGRSSRTWGSRICHFSLVLQT